MATKRQLERKKKDREAKARARVLARRHKIQSATREERRARALEDKFSEKARPFIKDPEKRAEIEASEERKVKERLERNMQVLKALEEEYEAEQGRRKEMNQDLESRGHETLKEKLGAMEEVARKIEGESSSEVSPEV